MEDQVPPTSRKEEKKRFHLVCFLPENPRLLNGREAPPCLGSRTTAGSGLLLLVLLGFGLLVLLGEQLASATWPSLRLQRQ